MEAHLLKGGTNAKATDSDLSKVVIVDKTSQVINITSYTQKADVCNYITII